MCDMRRGREGGGGDVFALLPGAGMGMQAALREGVGLQGSWEVSSKGMRNSGAGWVMPELRLEKGRVIRRTERPAGTKEARD